MQSRCRCSFNQEDMLGKYLRKGIELDFSPGEGGERLGRTYMFGTLRTTDFSLFYMNALRNDPKLPTLKSVIVTFTFLQTVSPKLWMTSQIPFTELLIVSYT